jgi:hypothetical protein
VNVTRETTNRNQDPLNSATETRLGGAQTSASKTAEALDAHAADLLIGTGAETADALHAHPADLVGIGAQIAEALHADAAEKPIGRHMRAMAHPATPGLHKDILKSAEEPMSGPCPLQDEIAATRQMTIGSLGTQFQSGTGLQIQRRIPATIAGQRTTIGVHVHVRVAIVEAIGT